MNKRPSVNKTWTAVIAVEILALEICLITTEEGLTEVQFRKSTNDQAKSCHLFGPNFKWEGATRGARLAGAVLFDPAPREALVGACTGNTKSKRPRGDQSRKNTNIVKTKTKTPVVQYSLLRWLSAQRVSARCTWEVGPVENHTSPGARCTGGCSSTATGHRAHLSRRRFGADEHLHNAQISHWWNLWQNENSQCQSGRCWRRTRVCGSSFASNYGWRLVVCLSSKFGLVLAGRPRCSDSQACDYPGGNAGGTRSSGTHGAAVMIKFIKNSVCIAKRE
jgi:hypothetical protein